MTKIINIISTGGTIASKVNLETGLFEAGAMNVDAFIDKEKFNQDFTINMETIFNIDSCLMTFELLYELKTRINEIFKNKDIAGVIVAHGTDTLEESVYFLSLCINDERPVIVTGSQRIVGEEGSDAFCNIRDAITAVASGACKGLGVIALFNQHIYDARYIHKEHTFALNAFNSRMYGTLGFVDGDFVNIAQRPTCKDFYDIKGNFERIEIIKACIGMDGIFIEAATKAGAKGIILEGLGRGHIPPTAADTVTEATNAGVKVIICSDCANGRVLPLYALKGGLKDLEERGAIQGFDYSAKKARVKLAALFASGITSSEEIKKAFSK